MGTSSLLFRPARSAVLADDISFSAVPIRPVTTHVVAVLRVLAAPAGGTAGARIKNLRALELPPNETAAIREVVVTALRAPTTSCGIGERSEGGRGLYLTAQVAVARAFRAAGTGGARSLSPPSTCSVFARKELP